jgi:hypothetical protein
MSAPGRSRRRPTGPRTVPGDDGVKKGNDANVTWVVENVVKAHEKGAYYVYTGVELRIRPARALHRHNEE